MKLSISKIKEFLYFRDSIKLFSYFRKVLLIFWEMEPPKKLLIFQEIELSKLEK